jgi:DNA polymerase-3 subunit gamma/tau
MLTRGAEAALLKTLEEPPDQVVFVLATTDPQKVSETIRSRVQHLQFHLLPVGELKKYVKFVIKEAGLTVDEDSIDLVLRQGGGSARDTLSALELVVSGGGEPEVALHTEDIITSLVARDHAAALGAVARAMQQGRDPHTYAQDVVRTMRDCFLALMSPELVQLPADRIAELTRYAQDMGVQSIVRIMETLGSTMVEMRHAPDARLLLEVAVVQLASPVFDDSAENLLARISQLEEAVKTLRENGIAAALPQAPINPATGRAKIGGLAGNTAPVAVPVADATPVVAVASEPAAVTKEIPVPAAAETPAKPTEPVTAPAAGAADPAQMWPQITDAMRGLAKAMFKPAVVQSVDGKKIMLRLPSNTPMKRAQEQLPTVVEAIKQVCGATFVVTLVQADPTAPGGMARPVLTEPEVRTIVDDVADDPFAAIDINDTVLAVDAVDPLLAALHDTFPGGSIVEKEVETNSDAAKSPRGKK